MAAIENEIDLLFLATTNQSEPGGGDGTRAIMLNASSPAGFKRSTTGALTPASIVFDAVPLNMAGAVVTWTTDGVALTKTGNTATLTATAMGVATSAVVKCTLDFENVRYERTFVVQVVADGKNGDSTELTATQIKAALEGQITETELFADLRTRIGLIDAGAGVTGSVAARVKTETDARVAGLTKEAADRTTYVQGYTYSKAQTDESLSIQANTITAAYTAYADEARRLAGVASSADIRNYAYSKANADEALTAMATTLRSEFSSNNGATVAYVQNYTYSKANTDSAISSMATTLRSEFSNSTGVTAAWVQNYAYSKTEANSAIASQTQDLRTTVGNNSAAISTQAESVNGLRAQYTVKIDNNGYVTGYGLASSYANGIPTSSFIINADRFAVVAPGVAPRVMFSVGQVNGQTSVGINGNLMLDGSVKANSLQVGGDLTNLVRDPRFKNLAWWSLDPYTPGGANVQVTDWNGTSQNAWRHNVSVYFRSTGGVQYNTETKRMPLTPGATYLAEYDLFFHDDWAGDLTVWLNVPNWAGNLLGGLGIVPDSGYPFADGNGIQYPGYTRGWKRVSAVFTVPSNIPSATEGSFLILRSIRSGTVEIGGFNLIRLMDSVLIKDGAITAEKVAAKAITADKVAAKAIKADNIDVVNLSAASGVLGDVLLGANGALHQGTNAYNTGTGIYYGAPGGVPKFFAGTAGGANIRWSPEEGLRVDQASLESYTAWLSGSAGGSYPNGSAGYGFLTANTSGGKPPYTYRWTLTVETKTGNAGNMAISSTTSQSASFSGSGTNATLTYTVTCAVTDGNQRTIILGTSINANHGTPP